MSRWIGQLLAYLLVVLGIFVTSPLYISVYDEGLILTGAIRTLAGEVPSTDFYTNYGPAQFYLLGSLLQIFGKNLLVARVYDSLILITTIFIFWRLVRPLTSDRLAVIATCSAFLLLAGIRAPLYPVLPCIALALLGCQLLIKALNSESGFVAYFCIGMIPGTALLFRYDIGLILLAAFGGAIVLVHYLKCSQKGMDITEVAIAVLKPTLAMAIPIIAIIAILWLSGILQAALLDLFNYNSKNYVAARSLPFPSLLDLTANPKAVVSAYFPILCAALGVVLIVPAFFSGQSVDHESLVSILALTLLTLLCYIKGIVRTHEVHLLLANVPALALLAVCANHIAGSSQGILSAFFGVKAQAALQLALLACCALLILKAALSLNYLLQQQASEFNRGGVFAVLSPREVFEAAQYINDITLPGDRILSATGRHDKIFANNTSVYFLANRLPGTRWHQYDPGVQTTARVQSEMIEELEEYAVSVILVDSRFDEVQEPNSSANSSGVVLLDDYIAEHFNVVRTIGSLRVLKRCEPGSAGHQHRA